MPQLKIKDNGTWVDIPAGGVGVPSGGTQGQLLQKSSSVDYATEWGANIGNMMGVPDYANAVDVPALWSQGNSYVVPSNGYLHFEILMSGAGIYSCEATVGSVHYRNFFAFQSDATGNRIGTTIPVSKGMTITCYNMSNVTLQPTGTVDFNYYPKFIPCK